MGETHNPLRDLFTAMTGDGARGFEQFFTGWPNPADWAKGEMQGLLGPAGVRLQRARRRNASSNWRSRCCSTRTR